MNSTNQKPVFKINATDFDTTESFWLDYTDTKGKSLIDIRKFKKDKSAIADALMLEFTFSSEEQKKKFKPMLLKWLEENELELNDKENFYQLRDLIYEMF